MTNRDYSMLLLFFFQTNVIVLYSTSWVAWLRQVTHLDPQKNNPLIFNGIKALTPSYHDSKYSNKSIFVSSLVSACSFGNLA